jgi:hypothetical protein
MLIFVCGPYTAGSRVAEEENVQRALRVATSLFIRGHQPFVPHLSHFWHHLAAANGTHIPYERWMAYTLAWLRKCDAVLYLGPSPGADREVALARTLGLTIYTDPDDVPD